MAATNSLDDSLDGLQVLCGGWKQEEGKGRGGGGGGGGRMKAK